MPLLTYPVVLIRGRWIGGGDDLQRLADADDAQTAAGQGAAGGATGAVTLSHALAEEKVAVVSTTDTNTNTNTAIPWGKNMKELSKPKQVEARRA